MIDKYDIIRGVYMAKEPKQSFLLVMLLISYARGIGSKRVPMNPAVMSKVYWSVSIPRMLYGIEVVPLSDKDINDLEKAHRQNGKIIMNVPPFCS